jgi:hypothetical protein
MTKSIFADLTDIADTLSSYTHDFPPGPQRDKLEDLVHRLDAVIDRTIGLEQADVPADE